MSFLKKLSTLTWIGVCLVVLGLLFSIFQLQIVLAFGEAAYNTIFVIVCSVVFAGLIAVCAIMVAKKQWISLLVTLLCAATLFIPF